MSNTHSPFPPFPTGQPVAGQSHIARGWLEEGRVALWQAFRRDGDADACLSGHARLIDALLVALHAAGPEAGRSCLLAVGGYGRSELYPHSDIDLLFLHEPEDETSAAAATEFLLYCLWDMGLKPGHALRSMPQALELAMQDITVRTGLLDARFLAGDSELFSRFCRRFQTEIVDTTALDFVETKLAERDARHQRFGDSRYLLEPNVKEGKGGLRDAHTLWWLARYTHPVYSLSDFAKQRLLADEEYQLFDEARRFLAKTRIHLHLLAEGPDDRLTFDRQQQLAPLMGYAHPVAHRAVARFMRRYFVAVRTIGSITRIFCALLEDEKKRKPRQPLGWIGAWRPAGPFRLEGERLDAKSDKVFIEDPARIIELFHVAQAHDLDIHPRALQQIARHLHLVDDNLRADARANQLFLEILLSPKGPQTALGRMSDTGVLGKFIPDFGRIIGQTQFNMYHVYTVDEHTLVALGYLHRIETGELKDTVPLASELMPRIGMRRVLYLALFCHDIAKGRGGDHSEMGEKIVRRLGARFGMSMQEIDAAGWLVRQHLLLSQTATKRDINDPKTLSDFVAEVQTPERLKLLLVLTVADMCAVRPGVWNAWKGALMRELFYRAMQAMGAGPQPGTAHDTQRLRQDLLQRRPGWGEAEVEHYLSLGPPAFRVGLRPAQHEVVSRMLEQVGQMAWPLMTDIQHDYDHSITEIMVCAFDQHGLFARLSGALSLAGANIVSAKIFTLAQGIAIDVFQLQDAAGEPFDRPDRLARMAVYIEQALSGEMDLRHAFHRRPRIGSRSVTDAPGGQVFIDNEASTLHTVVEVSGQDRSGLLYAVTQALADMGLSIVTAHISTYGTQVADVFYVKDAFGLKITHEAKLAQVRQVLAEAIR